MGFEGFGEVDDRFSHHFPELEHLGLNNSEWECLYDELRKRLGWQQEACIRRVRYWQGTYYDSVKYGVPQRRMGSKRQNPLSLWLGGFSCLQLLIAYEDMSEFLVSKA